MRAHHRNSMPHETLLTQTFGQCICHLVLALDIDDPRNMPSTCCIRALLNHPLHIHGRPMNRTCSSTLLTMCRHCCSHKARLDYTLLLYQGPLIGSAKPKTLGADPMTCLTKLSGSIWGTAIHRRAFPYKMRICSVPRVLRPETQDGKRGWLCTRRCYLCVASGRDLGHWRVL